MKLSYKKIRAINSYKNYVGDFGLDKSSLMIENQWFIDDRMVTITNIDVPIVESKIHWVGTNLDDDVKDFFDKALKLIVFG
jgi:hypothetical protein